MIVLQWFGDPSGDEYDVTMMDMEAPWRVMAMGALRTVCCLSVD